MKKRRSKKQEKKKKNFKKSVHKANSKWYTNKAVGESHSRSSLKIEQQDERKTPKILLNFIKCCMKIQQLFQVRRAESTLICSEGDLSIYRHI